MKKVKAIFLKGIPASGKTTWAKEFIKSNPKYVRVNRDDIRSMLSIKWSRDVEKTVVQIQQESIFSALDNGYNVIIDDTNLSEPKMKELKDYIKCAMEFSKLYEVTFSEKFFDISLKEAIKRDSERENPVGQTVIKRFYYQYINKNPKMIYNTRNYPKSNINLNDAIIVDIDGTVALMNGRNGYDYKAAASDLPNKPIVDLVNSVDCEVIFLSGREGTEESRKVATEWLNNYIKKPYRLYMREAKDYRSDELIKKEIYNNLIKDNYNVRFILDDRDRVVKMWRDELNLCCLQVYYGNF